MTWFFEKYSEKMNKWLVENLPKELEGFEIKVQEPDEGKATMYGLKFAIFDNPDKEEVAFDGYKYKRRGSSSWGMEFILQGYSACCAFEQMNYFSYGSKIPEEKIKIILNYCISMMRKCYKTNYAKKLVLNTVEFTDERYSADTAHPKFDPRRKQANHHQYSKIFEWATGHKEFVDTPIVNHNTGNIIHHIITFPEV